MDNGCPIALLLPGTKGMGVCSTALTYFLVNTHGEFLGTFRSLTNQERYCFVTQVYFPTDDSLGWWALSLRAEANPDHVSAYSQLPLLRTL